MIRIISHKYINSALQARGKGHAPPAKQRNTLRLKRLFWLLPILLVLLTCTPLPASDTMLMFVGEDLEVLSLVSRREEAAWEAPAIAHVITEDAINNRGKATLADLLENTAGFYINDRERGSVPYLRGIPDSALFLYDTVPMGSGAEKSNHHINHETALAAVKRVEIVRGAGSVLWGPDAFAGVVNVVPHSGKSFQGVETGAGLSSEDEGRWAYLNWGTDRTTWNAFVSISAENRRESDDTYNVLKFWNDGISPTPNEERWGSENPGTSQYQELYASIALSDYMTLSTRLTDNHRVYTVSNSNGDTVWQERRSDPVRSIKLEASWPTGIGSGVRFTGYYRENNSHLDIIDKTFSPSEHSLYAELIHDQSLFSGSSLITTGVSWRKNTFRDLLVWKSFFPDYLDPENTLLLPLFETTDYENRLLSLFGQYRHKFSDVELWAGIRNDAHQMFENKISCNMGLAWDFLPNWIFKTVYGTAYRTPSAEQVAEGLTSQLEQIDSVNAQLAWQAAKGQRAALTLFRNTIHHHIISDRYSGAGLSTPNSQTLLGIELEWHLPLWHQASFFGNLTLMENRGPDEIYNYGRYFYEDASGQLQEDFFQTLNYAYDAGADTLVNLGVDWRPTPRITLTPSVHYVSDTCFHYLEETDAGTTALKKTLTAPAAWVVDLNIRLHHLAPFTVDLFFNNLLDEHHVTPGRYTLKEENPFRAGITISRKW